MKQPNKIRGSGVLSKRLGVSRYSTFSAVLKSCWLPIALFATATPVWALNECGVLVSGSNTITCAPATYSSGIVYTSGSPSFTDLFTLNLGSAGNLTTLNNVLAIDSRPTNFGETINVNGPLSLDGPIANLTFFAGSGPATLNVNSDVTASNGGGALVSNITGDLDVNWLGKLTVNDVPTANVLQVGGANHVTVDFAQDVNIKTTLAGAAPGVSYGGFYIHNIGSLAFNSAGAFNSVGVGAGAAAGVAVRINDVAHNASLNIANFTQSTVSDQGFTAGFMINGVGGNFDFTSTGSIVTPGYSISVQDVLGRVDFNVHDVTNSGDADLSFIGGPQTITISRVGVTGSPTAGGVYLHSTGTIAALPEYPVSIFGSSAIFIRDVYSGAVTLDLNNVSGDVGIVAVTKGSVDFDAHLLEAGKLRIEDVADGNVTVDGGTFNFMPHGYSGASITGVNGDVTVGGNSDLNVVMGGPESGHFGGEVAFEIGDLTKKVIGDVDLKLKSIISTGDIEGRIAYIQDVVGKTTVAVAGDASNMYGGVSIMRNTGDVAVTLHDFHNKINDEIVASDKNSVVSVDGTLSGNVTVNTNDLVSNGFGVRAFNTALGNVNLTSRDIDSRFTSMVTLNTTIGDVNFIARDLISLQSPGIVAANTTIGNVTATVHDVTGDNAGIVISNTLAGNVVVTAHNVTGRTFTPDVPLGYAAGDAIHISNTGGSTLLNLSGNVIGADSGVDILGQHGNVTINLDAGGSIVGLQGIAISLLSAAGTTNVINAHGNIFGAVVGGDGDDTFINNVTWLAGLGGGVATVGTLGGGNNRIVNNGVFGVGDLTANVGSISYVGGSAMSTVTVSNARFENNGLITLSNAHYAGGPTFTGDRLTINGDFVAGAGSKLVMDAALGGPGSAADRLTINGNMSGITRLVVNNVTPRGGASNSAGIALIDVNGSASLANVVLDGGPIESGLFTYDLAFAAGNGEGTPSEFALRSEGPSSVAATLPDLLSPAVSVMLSSFDTWSDRQGDLRASLSRSSPRASSVKPAGVTETANGEGPGVWGKGFASSISYDRSGVRPVGGSTFNHDTDFNQALGGFLLGADHVSFSLPSSNGTLVVGAMGGFATADIDFNASGSKARFEGPVFGAYASYINNKFYMDAVIQTDLLEMSATLGTAGSVSNVNANSLGARFETGYRFETGRMFIDPSVALSRISSSIDDISIPGANIHFQNAESLTARSALRIGENFNMANGMAVTLSGTLGVNHELLDGFTATLSNGITDYGLTSSLPGTTYDAGLGLDIVKDNISFFCRSTTMFGNGLTGIGGKLGLSIRF